MIDVIRYALAVFAVLLLPAALLGLIWQLDGWRGTAFIVGGTIVLLGMLALLIWGFSVLTGLELR